MLDDLVFGPDREILPIGKPVTTLRVALGDRHMMIHTGVTSRNVTGSRCSLDPAGDFSFWLA